MPTCLTRVFLASELTRCMAIAPPIAARAVSRLKPHTRVTHARHGSTNRCAGVSRRRARGNLSTRFARKKVRIERHNRRPARALRSCADTRGAGAPAELRTWRAHKGPPAAQPLSVRSKPTAGADLRNSASRSPDKLSHPGWASVQILRNRRTQWADQVALPPWDSCGCSLLQARCALCLSASRHAAGLRVCCVALPANANCLDLRSAPAEVPLLDAPQHGLSRERTL